MKIHRASKILYTYQVKIVLFLLGRLWEAGTEIFESLHILKDLIWLLQNYYKAMRVPIGALLPNIVFAWNEHKRKNIEALFEFVWVNISLMITHHFYLSPN